MTCARAGLRGTGAPQATMARTPGEAGIYGIPSYRRGNPQTVVLREGSRCRTRPHGAQRRHPETHAARR